MLSKRKLAVGVGAVLLRSGLHDLFGDTAAVILFWATLGALAVLGQGIVVWRRARGD